MLKKIIGVYLYTFLTVHLVGLFKSILPDMIEQIKVDFALEYSFWEYSSSILPIFIIVCVIAGIISMVVLIIKTFLSIFGIDFNKPEIAQMNMHIDEEGYVDKAYFITMDKKKIPVNIYKKEVKTEEKNNG